MQVLFVIDRDVVFVFLGVPVDWEAVWVDVVGEAVFGYGNNIRWVGECCEVLLEEEVLVREGADVGVEEGEGLGGEVAFVEGCYEVGVCDVFHGL